MSARLGVPDEGRNSLSKGLLSKMASMLRELGVPERPTPTQMTCDLYDGLRRDMVTLLSIRKLVDKGAQEADALREQLAGNASGGSGTTPRGGGGGSKQGGQQRARGAGGEGRWRRRRRRRRRGAVAETKASALGGGPLPPLHAAVRSTKAAGLKVMAFSHAPLGFGGACG